MAAACTKKSVLFVCLGNICRSTMAEGILLHLVSKRKDADEWSIDSCGTASWNNGQNPYPDTMKTLKKHGINDYTHVARNLVKSDFDKFQWIFVMDNENYADVRHSQPGGSDSKVILLRDYDPEKDCESPIVIDPYFEDDKKYFEICYQQCVRSLTSFLEKEY